MSGDPMRAYTVMFDLPGDVPEGDRRTVVHEGAARTAVLVEGLRMAIVGAGLEDGLGGFGEPTPFGMASVSATPELAAWIARAPGVRGVVPD